MMKSPLLSILLLATVTSTSVVVEASEQLHYRLSYSGLITGFFWKQLADVTFNLQPEAITFRQERACRLTAEIDTSAYRFAEMVHPVRYHWESVLSTDLQRTLLTRAIDTGKSDIHEVAWYDGDSRTIALFRKRRTMHQNRNIFRTDSKQVWERDRHPPPATFIDPHPPLDNGLRYLIQTDAFKEILSDPAIDPLSMIQRVRRHTFASSAELQMLVALDEELHRYRATVSAYTPLRLGAHLHNTTQKVEVVRTSDKGQKGAMYLWFSNDTQRLPLRIDIKAPLGMIHMELMRVSERSARAACRPLPLTKSVE